MTAEDTGQSIGSSLDFGRQKSCVIGWVRTMTMAPAKWDQGFVGTSYLTILRIVIIDMGHHIVQTVLLV